MRRRGGSKGVVKVTLGVWVVSLSKIENLGIRLFLQVSETQILCDSRYDFTVSFRTSTTLCCCYPYEIKVE